MNPQYFMTLKTPDDDDVAGECTCIISLMQIGYRKRRTTAELKQLIIGFDVHLVHIIYVCLDYIIIPAHAGYMNTNRSLVTKYNGLLLVGHRVIDK